MHHHQYDHHALSCLLYVIIQTNQCIKCHEFILSVIGRYYRIPTLLQLHYLIPKSIFQWLYREI